MHWPTTGSCLRGFARHTLTFFDRNFRQNSTMELFLGDVCCKLESLWAWDIAAHDLPTWREVFSVSDWDTMTPKYVFPSLASHYAKSSASIHTLKTRPHQSAFLLAGAHLACAASPKLRRGGTHVFRGSRACFTRGLQLMNMAIELWSSLTKNTTAMPRLHQHQLPRRRRNRKETSHHTCAGDHVPLYCGGLCGDQPIMSTSAVACHSTVSPQPQMGRR